MSRGYALPTKMLQQEAIHRIREVARHLLQLVGGTSHSNAARATLTRHVPALEHTETIQIFAVPAKALGYEAGVDEVQLAVAAHGHSVRHRREHSSKLVVRDGQRGIALGALGQAATDGDVAAEALFPGTMDPAVDRAMPETDCVRGELRGFWKFRSVENGRKTFVVTEMHGDPKGSVPKFLVNWFQSNWARSTLQSLRAQLAKKDVKVLAWIQAALAGKPYSVEVPHAPPR